ncbi:hypothetical protein CENSYa_1362 [Cenarchaeum symbiosum A]|uniref:Uncharacterized protein n=1 Tax=Cenarchaeum symbiosum (strain A) TaxID=414004 RepID=A0RXB8_CENSY|nr:hypothetical protein CENSYa_1362 [Cenarchaeum symbiosum A]
MTGNKAANWTIVVSVIIASMAAALWAAYEADRHVMRMESLWPFENATYHGSVEDHMGEIRGLPEVESFHEMYAGHGINFSDRTLYKVQFEYVARGDGGSAHLIIGYYDREPSSFLHICSHDDPRRELFREKGIKTDCFSHAAPGGGPP